MLNRSEILFLYDTTWSNPNGDPVDENKPRIDKETSKNIVTDVRLKRTIRDYLYEHKQMEIFVREIKNDQGNIQDAKQRAEDFLVQNGEKISKSKLSLQEMKQIIYENMVQQCIDVRLFGGTIPIEKSTKEKGSITLTGPVQFQMGSSMHKVKLHYVKGTGGFASKDNQTQKTFREEYVLPYSLITFYGVVNEKAAFNTKLREEDIELLLEAMWNGTKSLISRSKIGQQPRLLLNVVYKKGCFQIGELNRLVSFKSEKLDEEIRHVSEGILYLDSLVRMLGKYHDRIQRIDWIKDEAVATSHSLTDVCSALGIEVRELSF
ncbi:type I-B CRISPR-associated protein Cas7/Csh2 [Thermoactinomyces sp. FSL K6-2592]|jgi:CRISPR-associated protein Csh2|uniref:type I-B CRISPR-associated protein Cas7/Csh2 n=1 Tax=Thermoactinomyces sp. FSL K6-2592 TaxID=2975347 RepID=UPI0030F4BEB7